MSSSCFSNRVHLIFIVFFLYSQLSPLLLQAQEACGSLELESAMDQLDGLDRELEDTKQSAAAGRLYPLPGETAESAATLLGTTSKTVGSSMAQLLTAAAQGNEDYVGIAARDTANALKVRGCVCVCACACTRARAHTYLHARVQRLIERRREWEDNKVKRKDRSGFDRGEREREKTRQTS